MPRGALWAMDPPMLSEIFMKVRSIDYNILLLQQLLLSGLNLQGTCRDPGAQRNIISSTLLVSQ